MKDYSKPHWTEAEAFDKFTERMVEEMPVLDFFRNVVARVMEEELPAMLLARGITGQPDARHEEFEAVMEKLRNMPHMEAERQFDRYFSDLTPDDRAVLAQLITRPSIQRLADGARMPVDKFRMIKRNLPAKQK